MTALRPRNAFMFDRMGSNFNDFQNKMSSSTTSTDSSKKMIPFDWASGPTSKKFFSQRAREEALLNDLASLGYKFTPKKRKNKVNRMSNDSILDMNEFDEGVIQLDGVDPFVGAETFEDSDVSGDIRSHRKARGSKKYIVKSKL